jgi:hypothetical protein
MTVSYAAEVMPVRLRQYLTTYVNLCWVIGQIISSGVNRALVGNDTEWAYKVSSPKTKSITTHDHLSYGSFSDPLRAAMDLGLAYRCWYRFCPRVSLVVDPKGKVRRCREVFDAIDRSWIWIHRGRR